ncbi:hypothetical protein ABZU86_31490 [Streptomyces sp. NPDC005271]|uniref:hypothetical protein n=1 Tax=unclassified Streptomyces TaxID=2593676 RepID=UPI0033A50587
MIVVMRRNRVYLVTASLTTSQHRAGRTLRKVSGGDGPAVELFSGHEEVFL